MLPLFKLTHKYSAEVLSGVLTCKKAVMSLSEKINVLGRLCSGVSYNSGLDHEFSVKESAIYME